MKKTERDTLDPDRAIFTAGFPELLCIGYG